MRVIVFLSSSSCQEEGRAGREGKEKEGGKKERKEGMKGYR